MARIVFYVDHYDYFGGQKYHKYEFDNILEGWAKYKECRDHCFEYDDAHYRVKKPRLIPVVRPEVDKVQRWHARSEWEYQHMRKHPNGIPFAWEDYENLFVAEPELEPLDDLLTDEEQEWLKEFYVSLEREAEIDPFND